MQKYILGQIVALKTLTPDKSGLPSNRRCPIIIFGFCIVMALQIIKGWGAIYSFGVYW